MQPALSSSSLPFSQALSVAVLESLLPRPPVGFYHPLHCHPVCVGSFLKINQLERRLITNQRLVCLSKKELTISPQSATFSPLTMKMPLDMSPYLLPT